MASSPAPEAPIRRALVVGGPGAGKSTFARRLGEKLALPVIHLDFHYWRSGWQIPELDTWRAQAAVLAAAPGWIMDGNYSNTYDIRMPRADSLIWLDYPRAVCMRRVLLRIVKGYGRNRIDLPQGCPEKFDAEFLRFVWDFRRKHRRQIVDGLERFGGHLRVTRFGHDREAAAFLAMVGAS